MDLADGGLDIVDSRCAGTRSLDGGRTGAVWPRHRRRRAGIEVAGTYLLFPGHGSLLGTFACPFRGPVDKMELCVRVVVTAQELGAQVVVARKQQSCTSKSSHE